MLKVWEASIDQVRDLVDEALELARTTTRNAQLIDTLEQVQELLAEDDMGQGEEPTTAGE